MYESPYPPSYGLNSTTTVLLREWLWHWITYKGWYAIKQRNRTKPNKKKNWIQNLKKCIGIKIFYSKHRFSWSYSKNLIYAILTPPPPSFSTSSSIAWLIILHANRTKNNNNWSANNRYCVSQNYTLVWFDPVGWGWGCRIHWLHFCRGVRLTQQMTLNNLRVKLK